MTTSIDCVLEALLRELPSPWRKDPIPVPAFAITGPAGAIITLADDTLTVVLKGHPDPVVIPLGDMTFDELVRACADNGIGASTDPLSGPLLASTMLPEGPRTAEAAAASRWNRAIWNKDTWLPRLVDVITFSRWTSDTWRLLDPLAERLAFEDGNGDAGLAQLNLLTSAGVFADLWGAYCGIPRHPGESDEDYTARIRWELLRPRENNLALADLLEHDYPPLHVALVDDVVRRCFMPSDDIALRGRPLRGWYYNIATVGIDVEGGFPSADMIAAAEKNAACGVTVYVRGHYKFLSMPSPAGYDFAGSTIRFGVPIPIKINAPPPVGVGKIGPP